MRKAKNLMTTEILELSEMEGYQLKEAGDSIKTQYKTGAIAYETATEAMNVILAEVNKRGAVIAKKHKKKHHKITTISELR